MRNNSMPELGDEVVCVVTKMKGVLIAHSKHLTGCDRVLVQPQVSKEGKMTDAYWIDLAAVEILKKRKVKTEDVQEKGLDAKKGGPASRLK